MKYGYMILAALLVCGVVWAAQDTTLTERELRDPKQLEPWLEANASDAETRIAALEGGSTVGTVEPGYIIVGNASSQGVDVVVSGDITIATNGAVALAADCVAAAEMADADHGDVSWASGVATVDNVAAANISGNIALAAVTNLMSTGTLSTNVVIDASYTNTIVLRTLSSGIIIVNSWTQDAVE